MEKLQEFWHLIIQNQLLRDS